LSKGIFFLSVIIFTDLDGTLLNHDDYSYDEALPSLERIKKAGIPLIITTSKTRNEVEFLQQRIGINLPFIVENGGGIFIPDFTHLTPIDGGEKKNGYILIRIGETYKNIRSLFVEMALHFGLRGFGDMTIAEIAALTGLSQTEAERAKIREFTEPFLAPNSEDIGAIETCARSMGLKITKGGRFYHLLGMNQDKGAAVRKLIEIYRDHLKPAMVTSIGLGDSENDLPMLKQVDIPVFIPNPRNRLHGFKLKGLVRAEDPGPLGWNSAVESILDRIEER
jgi:mannosyl-3-phosphoglycerate phosphatase